MCEATRGVYQIGFVLRYCQSIQTIAELAPRLGTPALCRVSIFDEILDRNNRAHSKHFASQFGHHASGFARRGFFALWNASPFVSAHATAMQTESDFNGPNIWSAQLSTADGSVLEIEVGWLLPSLPPSTISVVGPNGYAQLDMNSGQGVYSHGGKIEKISAGPLLQNWRRQLNVFAQAIDEGEAKIATVEDGLRALTSTIACEESCKTG